MWFLVLVAVVLSVGSLTLSVLLWRERGNARPEPAEGEVLPGDVLGLRQEVAALRAEGTDALRHLAIVRYDALAEMGGRLSWSIAIVDDQGNGMVLTSINGRSDARTYAKSVVGWASDQQLTPEETEALSSARTQQ